MRRLILSGGYFAQRRMQVCCAVRFDGQRFDSCAIIWEDGEPSLYVLTPEGDEYFAPFALTVAERRALRAFETRTLNRIGAC